ncbi:MAG TPA: molybdenum cofactor biosynthesis protein MoaE [Gemmatimonadaceae bacterium]|nr:molybdenum cofactor biosynthesis protein MoaE [Gemmatimonadaceae bacterium]
MRVEIVERAIDATALLNEVAAITNGASVLFVGTVRDVNGGRPVTALDYRAYSSMAEAELSAIALEAEARWTPGTIVCEHRVGSLALGDVSVAIVAAHPHRGAAFDACRYVIEELKKRVPIWKREHYADGERSWVENAAGAQRTHPRGAER